ncbi:MAG: 2-amino-4-hydroxy-6-hydroxymethyldihydropteridine diphosphokinase [Cryobacterium sp.]
MSGSDARRAERVVLALGSNLGDRAATLIQAVQDLADVTGLQLSDVSRLYESIAVKGHGIDDSAPRYLNGVVVGTFRGDPLALLAAVNAIEAAHGRVRAERWGDRTLDIDIVLIGALEQTDARLTLPHPRAFERDFVLTPWLDVDPRAVLPGKGSVRDLLAATTASTQPYVDPAAAAGR